MFEGRGSRVAVGRQAAWGHFRAAVLGLCATRRGDCPGRIGASATRSGGHGRSCYLIYTSKSDLSRRGKRLSNASLPSTGEPAITRHQPDTYSLNAGLVTEVLRSAACFAAGCGLTNGRNKTTTAWNVEQGTSKDEVCSPGSPFVLRRSLFDHRCSVRAMAAGLQEWTDTRFRRGW
jgi:hypothetical protein